MEQILWMSLIGLLLGTGLYFLTRRMIVNRSGLIADGMLLKKRFGWLGWSAAGLISGVLTAAFIGMNAEGLETLFVVLLLSSLSVVDKSIRKIPNELLLALIVIRIVFLVIQGNVSAMVPALGGLLAGIFIFQLPAMLHISIGWGDIKYAGVAGFYLGLVGFFQAVIIMAIVLGIYAAYLLLTKRGNLMTKVAMGPSLSLGFLATILFPISVRL